MRIGIDARKIRDFGIGAYIENLIRHIPEFDTDNIYEIFHYAEDREYVPQTGANIKLIADSSPKYSLRELIVLPIKMWQRRPDLFHAPHYTLPPLRPCKGVVTIHDTIHLRFPEYLPHPIAYYYANGMMWAAANSAKTVITVSECSKQDIVKYLGIPETKVKVVYNGIESNPPDVSKNSGSVAARFGIARPYILYLGNFMPHKNHERLIRAYSLLKQRQPIPHCLVLAGKNERLRQRLETVIAEERVGQDVILTGFVEPEWIAGLYANADLFVYPSLYEGFGFQALEAMARHIPTAISDVSALPEIAGDAAIRFQPTSVENMAEVMYQGLTDTRLRTRLIEKGDQRVKMFSWQEMTRKTVQIYQRILRKEW